ncbi:MAG: C40 family peptidase [Clostridiales bacterium]|nr:C40 family peptidase [Clostridiales bacterium]
MIFRHNGKQHILVIIVGAAVAVPVLTFPIGVRAGVRPALAVSNAHKVAYGVSEEYNEFLSGDDDVEIEDWALIGDEGMVDGIGEEDDQGEPDAETDPDAGDKDEGQDSDPGSIPEDKSGSYSDVPKYTVYQDFDSNSNQPIELLDPQYFAADDAQYYVKKGNVALKEFPDMSKKTLGKLSMGEGVRRIGIGDTWSKIRTSDDREGYILSSLITDEMVWVNTDLYVWVDTDSLVLRKEASTKSQLLTTLHDEDRLHVVAYADKWYKVVTRDGTKGYVYKSFTTRTPPPTPTPTPTPRPTATKRPANSSRGGSNSRTGNVSKLPKITGKNGQSIVNIAASMLGVRYVYGGCSRRGIDCSGLVKYCYAQLGIYVYHGANKICNSYGVGVARSDIKLGDVVCYDYGNHCGHCAIYAGGGQVIHASMSRGRVLYGRLDMMPIRRIKRLIR